MNNKAIIKVICKRGMRVIGDEEVLVIGTQSPPDTRMDRLAGYDF